MTMTPIEEFVSRMDRLVSKNEKLFAAAIADFRAQYLEAIETTLSKRYVAGNGVIVGPVYVDEIPYVPKAELDKVRAALPESGETLVARRTPSGRVDTMAGLRA